MTVELADPPAVNTAVADLLLVRMALPTTSPKRVREDLSRVLPNDLSLTDFDELRNELTSAGLLMKGKRNTFALTDAGRERVLQFLGVPAIPPRTTWGAVISKYLFPKAADLPAGVAAKLDNADKLAAFFLKRKHGLPSGAGSTVSQVLEALVCREVKYPEETTLKGLLSAVFAKLLKHDERLDRQKLVKQFPRAALEVADVTADIVRRRVIRQWLADESVLESTSEPFDLPAFAATVRALAAGSPRGDRFHDNKVFIAPLWRASQREPTFLRLSLPEFKQALIEANSRSLLHLSRADLVQAMDPQLVAESETVHLNATFHFVLLEEPRP